MPSWPAVSGAETARRKPSCSGGSPRACPSTASATCGDPAAAAGLVQDVLLMAFDSLRAGKVREDERLASYVLGTCRRMAIGLARSTTRRQRLLENRHVERALGDWKLADGTLAQPRHRCITKDPRRRDGTVEGEATPDPK